jgi:cytidylate kinase
MKQKLIIAIDGPAGSGKSTVAKLTAAALGVPYIDTGAMYRAITLKAIRQRIPLDHAEQIAAMTRKTAIRFSGRSSKSQKVFLDGINVTKQIRTPELTKKVFYVAREPEIRREMVKKQKAMGRKEGAVMEGRDIGTVVFPNADYKIYLEADPKVRARRRYLELKGAGSKVTFSSVLRDLKVRDRSDYHRKVGPLKRAKDAFLLDTTKLTIKDVVDTILRIIQSKSLKDRRLN